MSLGKLRKKIDNIDQEILFLLNRRMKIALDTVKHKDDIEDKKREKEIFDNFSKISNPVFSRDFSDRIYKEILKESKRIQAKTKKI